MTLANILLWFAGFSLGMWIGEIRVSRVLSRLQFGQQVSSGNGQEPRGLLDADVEARDAIAPPVDIVSPEEIDRGTQQLLAMAASEGRELSYEEARRQASVMLMQHRGLLDD